MSNIQETGQSRNGNSLPTVSNTGEGKISVSSLWSSQHMLWFYKIIYIKWKGKDAVAVLHPDSMSVTHSNSMRYSVFLIKPGIIKIDMSLKCCFNHTKPIENAEYLCDSSHMHVVDNTSQYTDIIHLSAFDLDQQVMNNVEWTSICEFTKSDIDY